MRERRPGVWELRVRSGIDPVTGRYHQTSRSFTGSKRDAKLALARFATDVSDDGFGSSAHTVAALLDGWIDHLEMLGRSPKTIDGYRSLARAQLKPALGKIQLRKLNPAQLDAFYRGLIAEGLAPTTVRHCHATLSAALRQAVKWGWIARSPAERATPPPISRSEISPPDASEISALLTALEERHPDLAAMAYVAATTGCRRGELCGLRWSDVDTESMTITVRRSITETSKGIQSKDPKTHRSRRLAIDPSTTDVLVAEQRRMVERSAQCGVSLAPDPYIWSQEADGSLPWAPNRVTYIFQNVRDRLGLSRVNFHHLRHFAAATLAGAGVDVRTIAGRLGHANPSVTLQTYAHFLEVADRRAADVMGGIELRRNSDVVAVLDERFPESRGVDDSCAKMMG